MSKYIYVSRHIFVCIYKYLRRQHTHTQLRVSTSRDIYVFRHICPHICIHIFVCIYKYLRRQHAQALDINVSRYIFMCIHTYIYVHTVYVNICLHQIYVNICLHTIYSLGNSVRKYMSILNYM